MPRHQLPTYSPLTAGALVRALLPRRGDPREALRRRLLDRYGARDAVLCGSGTQALTLALRMARRGTEVPLVALPAYACYDLVSAAVGADARIVFYDVTPETLSPDLASLAEACQAKPDAVVVAPLFGIPVDWDGVEAVVRSTGALLVEDAAQGLGAEWRGRPLGSLGDVSILSFGRGKGWTGGAGGALLLHAHNTQAPTPASAPRSSAGAWLRAAAQWALGRPSLYWIPAGIPALGLGETRYHPPVEPARMGSLVAGLILAHEALAVREAAVRRRNGVVLAARLGGFDGGRVIGGPDPRSAGYLRLPLMLVSRSEGRFLSLSAMAAHGVIRGYPTTLDSLPQAKARMLAPRALPGATALARDIITIPTHSLTTDDDRERVSQALLG